ncbi:MAG: hypothetical protein HYR48_01065 [Gemmatimonadetes bacterium]|nr:hypothetical protein [Gemmatimonadota bacterium]
MTTPTRLRLLLPATLALLFGVLAACSRPDLSMVEPNRNVGPSFWVGGDPEPGAVQVCNYGPAGTYGFTVQSQNNSGTFPLGSSFTLAADECQVVWRTTSTAATNVRVTETSIPTGVKSDSVVGFQTELATPQVTYIAPTLAFDFKLNSDHSGSARFYNSPSNPPPPPRRITICKIGPAGTYDFTATATGGNVGTLLLGPSFTIDAGQCADVWESKPPTTDPDPRTTVTVSEVNLSSLLQLDSIQVDTTTYGRGPATTSGNTVTFVVNAFHDGFATFYNSQVPPPANCGGLTPGYWKNWRNKYTTAQFTLLLQGTIASGSITLADQYLKANNPAIPRLRKFVLANQLTQNLTQLNAGGAGLPNPSGGNLVDACSAGGGQLGPTLTIALQILANPSAYTTAYIDSIKDILDAIANLGGG